MSHREIRGWLFSDGGITAEGVRYVPATDVERLREQANDVVHARNRAWDAIIKARRELASGDDVGADRTLYEAISRG